MTDLLDSNTAITDVDAGAVTEAPAKEHVQLVPEKLPFPEDFAELLNKEGVVTHREGTHASVDFQQGGTIRHIRVPAHALKPYDGSTSKEQAA